MNKYVICLAELHVDPTTNAYGRHTVLYDASSVGSGFIFLKLQYIYLAIVTRL